MASSFYNEMPTLLPNKSAKFQAKCKNSKKRKAIKRVENTAGWAENMLMVSELRKKVLIFRDVIDLPPCDQSGSIHQLIIGTIEDLSKLYPDVGSCNMTKMSISQGLINFYGALESIAAIWAKSNQWMTNSEDAGGDSLKSVSLDQLGVRVLTKLNHMTETAGQIFDAMDEDEENNENRKKGTTFGDILNESYSDKKSCGSPDTPDSFPSVTEQNYSWKPSEFANISFSPPRLLPLRLRSLDKLMFPEMKGISFNASVHKTTNTCGPMKGAENSDGSNAENLKGAEEVHMEEACDTPKDVKAVNAAKEHDVNLNVMPQISKMEAVVPVPASLPSFPPSSPNKSSPPPTPIPPSQTSPIPPPPLPPTTGSTTVPSIPPPPIPPSKGSAPVPPPPLPPGKGGAPPPPPPGGMAKALRARKVTTKLKRSTHMGKLYNALKGKVEGVERRKSPHGKKGRIGGGSAGGKQGMADALAEMTKRSSYFQQIEEDVKKYGKMIKELKTAITTCQTKDMAELIKFHRYVEDNLEKLSDETQVLAKFEGFPTKKLEALRSAAALYLKVEGIARELENWKIVPPLGRLLDKVEAYFNKIKEEVDALERTKDEETKRFESQNIYFDFGILVRIKESMVDVSSGCMELALQERRETKAAANTESSSKTEGRTKACVRMLWRAFQLAFRVYNFAGGQDDRADRLTRELAQEIETTDPPRE